MDPKDYTRAQVEEIVAEAQEAARVAALDYFYNTLKGQDAWPCGFAWVEVYGVKGNTKLGKILKAIDFRHKMWNPANAPFQNMDALYAGARAASAVLKTYGFNAVACDRID